MWVVCCFEVGWISKNWCVTFVMVPPKDKFAEVVVTTIVDFSLNFVANTTT
jgi:hypothetical protein